MRRNIAGSALWESLVGYSRVVLGIIAGALAEAGAELRHVVRTRIYVTDISQWEAVGRAHGEVFGTVRPVSSMVQVAALIDPQHLVEIGADAHLWDEGEASSGS